MVEINFSVTAEEPRETDFPLIPDGDYSATIVHTSEQNTLTNPANKKLVIEYKLDNGRTTYSNLNLWNTSDQAVQIANEQLNKICIAVDIAKLNDTDQLLSKRVKLTISTKPANGEWKARNEVKYVNKIEKTVQPQPKVTTQTENAAPPSAPTPAQPPASSNAWDL